MRESYVLNEIGTAFASDYKFILLENAINEAIRLLRSGQVDGRAVIIPK